MDQQWSCWTRPAEQLDIMPFPSDFFKSLASLVHQIHGPAMIVLEEASRATWHHAFSIRFFQITCFPCPSDSWTSNDRAGRGQQSNLTSCLFHQIFSNHLLPLSIRFMDQQWSCWTRPAEQLDIMPFPSDFFKSLASLVHQIPSNDLWGWGNQRENQSGLASRSNLLSCRDENLYFTWFYKSYFHVGTTHCDHLSYMFSWHSLGRSLKVSSSLCFACPSDSDEVWTALVAAETSVATWHDGIAMLGQVELRVHVWGMLILNDLGP